MEGKRKREKEREKEKKRDRKQKLLLWERYGKREGLQAGGDRISVSLGGMGGGWERTGLVS